MFLAWIQMFAEPTSFFKILGPSWVHKPASYAYNFRPAAAILIFISCSGSARDDASYMLYNNKSIAPDYEVCTKPPRLGFPFGNPFRGIASM